MIELKDVSCSFSDHLAHKGRFTTVSSMTANFEDGGRYTIVRESGSDRITLVRMVAGLQRLNTRAISVNGSLVYGRARVGKEHFKKAQIIQQNSASALDPKLLIGRSTEGPLLCFFQMGKVQRQERYRQLMELYNLPEDYYTQPPPKLSDGEQKWMAVAQAPTAEPQCLVSDEAINDFDLPLRKKIIDEITDLQHRLGFTLVFITHDMELTVVVANEIFVMRNSSLAERTAFSGDYSAFQNPYSRISLEASGLAEAPSNRNNKMKERVILQ